MNLNDRQRRCGARVLMMFAPLCVNIAQAALPHDFFLTFDGQNDVATLPSTPTLSPTHQVTVEAWVRPTSIPTTNSQARLVSKAGSYQLTLSTGDTGCGFGTRGAVQWRATIGGVDARICGGDVSLDDWHHVAGTYDGAVFALYVDGARVASTARAGAIAVTTVPVRFGNVTALDRPLSGALDEVRLWRRALIQTELQANADMLLTGSEPDLVAYHRLDERSGQILSDRTSNSNDGVLGATSGAESSDPVRTAVDQNLAPVVDAGPDQVIQWPIDVAQLHGDVQDDGLPSGMLTHQWSMTSGPGAVMFQNASALQTSVTFPTPGTYVLQLQANDGALSAADSLQVQVASSQTISSMAVTPRFITLGPRETQVFKAVARDSPGDPVQISVSWSASGGTISSTGLYTAPAAAGMYTVRATGGGITRTATVDVTSFATPWPTSGWSTATPDAMRMNPDLLSQARDFALAAGGSGMITRNGRLIMSWGSLTTRYDVKSTTKSIGAILVGLALEDGRIDLSDAAQLHLSRIGVPPTSNIATGWLEDITLLHLGTHTAGFGKPGGYTELLFRSGSAFSYSDGGANWLADVITSVYRTDLNTIAFSRAFTQMGITSADFRWRSNAYREDTLDGVKRREFGSGVTIDVDAMARIGYLYLRRGRWEGDRVLPDAFVQQVQQPQPEVVGLPVLDTRHPSGSNHYGFLFWTNGDSTLPSVPRDAHWSWGLGESFIIVIPSLDMVISRAGNGWRPDPKADYSVMAPFLNPIVAAVRDKLSVPQVVGQTQSAAVNTIELAGLAISGITLQSSSTVSPGRVISQAPTAGAQVARNTGVRLVIAR
jgi:CubicO group peptidase (beta-lactamase class C family)